MSCRRRVSVSCWQLWFRAAQPLLKLRSIPHDTTIRCIAASNNASARAGQRPPVTTCKRAR
ncbi:hypothetical protein TSOC_011819 [Tetrabaena socialis]|uniref:Uncharacterized protein n=1 Tax=Tetrabaena socialis TaxID=47790 RepID=A0A2J7ZPM4_9CHLO|nr:hypothetical protein TSOC_011819 [Tetrabaena socialis]|eukprot:PNH02224.1 hypothetical protein TSOC_011819 [Tetrabaena socialis]